jgi:kynurenine formamidase/predicted ester cyclase
VFGYPEGDPTMSKEENKVAVRLFYQRMDKGDLTVVDELVADNYVGHVPGFEDIHGRRGLKDLLVIFHTAFPDLQHIIEDLIVEEDRVVGRFTLHGTQKGEFMQIGPTNRMVTFTATGIYRFENGLLAEDWIEYDALAILRQIGGASAATDNLKLEPSEVIDLGTLVTEDLPQRSWGKAMLKQLGFKKQNAFEVIRWTFPSRSGKISGSNAYYTLFNHGGPHVDAPGHVGTGGGLNSYAIEAFAGPLKVFDVRGCSRGRSVPRDVFQDKVEPGDIVIIFTGCSVPETEDGLPEVTTLTNDAAEFLANLPVRAYGTDAFGVDDIADTAMPWIHYAFLSRSIPVYEQLCNLDKLLRRERMFFVGAPLNIRDGDGMIVRPVVLIY